MHSLSTVLLSLAALLIVGWMASSSFAVAGLYTDDAPVAAAAPVPAQSTSHPLKGS